VTLKPQNFVFGRWGILRRFSRWPSRLWNGILFFSILYSLDARGVSFSALLTPCSDPLYFQTCIRQAAIPFGWQIWDFVLASNLYTHRHMQTLRVFYFYF